MERPFLKITLISLILILPLVHLAQGNTTPVDSICISKAEMRLYNLINNLRKAAGKSEIPISYSLSRVAKIHTYDLETNHPDTSICNYHSWSDKGVWTACCYNPYKIDTECVRNKPAELTDYHYPGYELITWDSRKADPDTVFNLWNSFDASRNVFLNEGDWKRMSWKAIGLSISDHYVSIWFGDKADKAGEAEQCVQGVATVIDSLAVPASTGKSEFLPATGEYHIIYGSYSQVEDAENLKAELQNQFPQAGIIKGENNYRISLDRFPTMQEARKAKENYDSKFQDSWLLKY